MRLDHKNLNLPNVGDTRYCILTLS